ncbi:DUF3194 domain-containing protein [Haloplanus aerogenes]|uniref:DUF3194 domain-containing protein n=1 Tax=Haloplanus aerogenes TaxID=660522 RepID=UPI0037430F93
MAAVRWDRAAPAARKAVAEPDDETVVQTAAEAAEGVVFAHYRQSDVRDLDVTVTFEEGVLEVDVYLNAPDGEDDPDPEAVADEAARAAQDAVDDLFADDEA